MNFIQPLTDAQKRNRRPSGIMDDGEYLGFEVAFADAAPAGTASRFLTDADRSRALAAARYQDSAREAAITGLNAWRGGHHAAEHETRVADAQAARASINALRAARYTGE